MSTADMQWSSSMVTIASHAMLRSAWYGFVVRVSFMMLIELHDGVVCALNCSSAGNAEASRTIWPSRVDVKLWVETVLEM